jgi:hypothetical protein
MTKREMATSDFHIVLLIVTIMGCTFCSFSLGHCIVLSFDLQLIITPLISSNDYNQCEKKSMLLHGYILT